MKNYYKEIKNERVLNSLQSEKEWNDVLNIVAESYASSRLENYGVDHVAYEIWNCDCFAYSTPEKVVEAYIDCIINYDM